jgi:ADP-ribose pyrophosphatase YjhB (NUDIX family)
MDSVAILARGHWPAERVRAHWREEHYEPPVQHAEAADAAIEALRERGSPSHDGLAARLVAHAERGDELVLELQPVRWALRLVHGDASESVAALAVTRAADGRWLAGRRAPWLSSWPGRWALGAGGAVDIGESPAHTLRRELQEEWSVQPSSLTVEALVRLPHQLVMVVGLAWLPDGAEIEMDDEHDAHAWWPADVADWPAEADEPLRRMATMLAAGT